MRLETPPFPRGGTYYGGGTIDVPQAGEFLGGFNLEGAEYEFQDPQLPGGGYGTGMSTRVRVVRNSTGINVKPSQCVTLLATTRVIDLQPVLPGTNADAIATAAAAHSFPADEFLPPQGVPNGDLFYVVVEGPCLCFTGTAAAAIALDQKVINAAAAGTTSPGAGGVVAQDMTQLTVNLGNQVQNAIGRAMSAMLAASTSQPVLIDVGW